LGSPILMHLKSLE